MDFRKYKDAFDRDGFVIVPGFLETVAFRELTEQLDRYIEEIVPTLPAASAFFQEPGRPETLKQLQHMGRDPYFGAYRENPRWRRLAETLLGEAAEAHQPEWFNKPPGAEHPTPPHQDNYYFCLRPPNVLTMWLALDDVDEGNGCLRYVRGSHLKGVRPHSSTRVLGFSQGIVDFGEPDLAEESTVRLKPGDLVVHHGETIHRAEPNRSTDRNRRAFAMVFQGASCQKDAEAFRRYQQALNVQHAKIGLQSAGTDDA